MTGHPDLDNVDPAGSDASLIRCFFRHRLRVGDSETHLVETLLFANVKHFLRTESIGDGEDHQINAPHQGQRDPNFFGDSSPPQERTEKKADHGPNEQKDEEQLAERHALLPPETCDLGKVKTVSTA